MNVHHFATSGIDCPEPSNLLAPTSNRLDNSEISPSPTVLFYPYQFDPGLEKDVLLSLGRGCFGRTAAFNLPSPSPVSEVATEGTLPECQKQPSTGSSLACGTRTVAVGWVPQAHAVGLLLWAGQETQLGQVRPAQGSPTAPAPLFSMCVIQQQETAWGPAGGHAGGLHGKAPEGPSRFS